MCTTVLHGGVCHRTSTPHKSGIKMKEKNFSNLYYNYTVQRHEQRCCWNGATGKINLIIIRRLSVYVSSQDRAQRRISVTTNSTRPAASTATAVATTRQDSTTGVETGKNKSFY